MKKKLGRPAGTKNKKTWSRRKKNPLPQEATSNGMAPMYQLTHLTLQMMDFVTRLCVVESLTPRVSDALDKLTREWQQALGMLQGRVNTLELLVQTSKPPTRGLSQTKIADFPNKINGKVTDGMDQ